MNIPQKIEAIEQRKQSGCLIDHKDSLKYKSKQQDSEQKKVASSHIPPSHPNSFTQLW
jgi:hypothetical protein